MTVKIYSGSTATGSPVETLTTTDVRRQLDRRARPASSRAPTPPGPSRTTTAGTPASAPPTPSSSTPPARSCRSPRRPTASARRTPRPPSAAPPAPRRATPTPVNVKVYSGSTATGTPVETLTTTATSGTWSVDSAGLAEGTYTARADQDDSVSNTGFSFPTTFTVDTTAPTGVTLDAPADGSTHERPHPHAQRRGGRRDRRRRQRRGQDLRRHRHRRHASPRRSAPPRTGTSWTVDASTLAEGTYTAQATQSDAAANGPTASSANTFTVDTTGPPA